MSLNFTSLSPTAQTMLYQKIIQFDLAATLLAVEKDYAIASTRKDLLTATYLFLTSITQGLDEWANVIFLKELASKIGLDPDSLQSLNRESLRAAAVWTKATDFALGDQVLQFKIKKDLDLLRQENLSQALTVMERTTQEDISLYWQAIDSGMERSNFDLPAPTQTKGEKLYNQASDYLEANGFEVADLGMYFPKPDGTHGIGLSSPDHCVAVCFVHGVTFDRSPWIQCTSKAQAIEVLDALIFAVKETSPE